MARTARTIVDECYAAIYSTNARHQRDVVAEHFSIDAVFEDPLVAVRGRDNCLLQYRILGWAFSSVTSDVIRVIERRSDGTHQFLIDAFLTFTILRILPLTLRVLTTFDFNAQGCIIRHEDIWSLREMIARVPILGGLYDRGWRRVVGAVTSKVAEAAGGLN